MLLILALAALAEPPAKTEIKVKVDGTTYRVLTRGDEVVIANKSFMTRRSPSQRDAMRKAAKDATSCEIKDDYWEGSRLVGKLMCGHPE
jgi:hypothetical protein